MSAKKYGKGRISNAGPSFRMNEKVADGPPVELENQFIMRLPGLSLALKHLELSDFLSFQAWVKKNKVWSKNNVYFYYCDCGSYNSK